VGVACSMDVSDEKLIQVHSRKNWREETTWKF
jgi:hypothetical protein